VYHDLYSVTVNDEMKKTGGHGEDVTICMGFLLEKLIVAQLLRDFAFFLRAECSTESS
jgi:hypothetical protein